MTSWGRWGAGDERGAANLVDAAATLRGVGTVRSGEVLALAHQMRPGNASPAVGRAPLQHFMARAGADYAAGRPERGGFGYADDYVVMATHGETHVDALSHVFKDGQMYNGFPASDVTSSGARRCGIETLGPLVTRGLLVDLAPLQPAEAVSAERLADAVDAAGVQPQPGDALLVHTGWARAWKDGAARADRWPGLDCECADWIADHDIAIVGADNVAVEAFPSSDPDCQVPLHVALLRGHGIYFCELLRLDQLAATGRKEFMFVLSALPLVGAVGSPVNPVAVL